MDQTAPATLFAWLDREVWLITAAAGGRRGGLIATFVSQASLVAEVPRVLICLAKHHFTWDLVHDAGHFAMHLLAESNLELVWQFGLSSGREVDKFEGLDATTGSTGCPLLPDTVGWLECRVETSLDIGDRTLFLGEVVEGRVTHFAPPLKASRLRETASPHRLREMQRKQLLDSYRDEEAIRAWRESRNS